MKVTIVKEYGAPLIMRNVSESDARLLGDLPFLYGNVRINGTVWNCDSIVSVNVEKD